ncbi:cyclic dehypoxanthinyl futalosine synthase [Geobacter sp. SVR]|uniref:cyclic dehypoxanthinyl futalosine synthase n=1 Tax=Geobacter sp. SVR TaxID=2495594 RepID=UPI00143EFB93|nr:cyclic dehypoxanthinyl futalosine synthase [Geobacter sp. SVR]BCS56108.1 cyclic dehypoxanthine futalosine synthase [Geobacter sp. SVR]GCF84871.1 cyclic dehypoxanthine futalosine synthase [Geobacter sp. SVR]
MQERKILDAVEGGERIGREEALALLLAGELLSLGRAADRIRSRLHPENLVSFVVDRNVNYTNICESKCSFCAFYRDQSADDAYVLSQDTILTKIAELVDQGGTQLLMQGGLNPALKIGFFEEMFREIKRSFPGIQNHSLSPAEITCIATASELSLDETLVRLKKAGLDSVPGGGAEILVDEVRGSISPNKIGWRKWGEVMLKAAGLGMPTTATMMFGSSERPQDIVEHLFRIRELQDAGGSFTAFIPWTYQPGNTELGGVTATGVEYLKVLALSRIVLDNVANIQASWVTQGDKMAQVALFFGANDLGGTMLEENVVAAAGCSFRMSREEMISLIQQAGFRAAQRTTTYQILREF